MSEDPVISALQPYGDTSWGQAGLKSQSDSLKLTWHRSRPQGGPRLALIFSGGRRAR